MKISYIKLVRNRSERESIIGSVLGLFTLCPYEIIIEDVE